MKLPAIMPFRKWAYKGKSKRKVCAAVCALPLRLFFLPFLENRMVVLGKAMMKLDQNCAPIYEALEAFRKMRVVPFDVPGHKRWTIFVIRFP